MTHVSATKSAVSSFITDTSAEAAARRGEEILGLPVIKYKTWNVTVIIEPAEAKQILLAMPPQRPLNKSNIRFFRNLILAGRFHVTHQGIAFDKDGYLIDGMHRLTACIDANAAIEIQVTFNMRRDLFSDIDRGLGRTPANDLFCQELAGIDAHARCMAAAARILCHLECGRVPWTSMERGEFPLVMMLDIIEGHPDLKGVVPYCVSNQGRFKGLGSGPLAAFYALFREVNPDKADLFVRDMVRPAVTGFGEPAYAMREYLRSHGSGAKKIVQAKAMIILVRCWNALIERRDMKKPNVKLRTGDNFPQIIGQTYETNGQLRRYKTKS